MRAYIAHGEADQAIADELREYLKPLGLFAETESGARGFRHLQKSDVVIALWSRNALFTVQRMQLEKRMLDAWADGQLILVKLDHNFFPVGMRDLPYIDATFEHARKTNAWREIGREAKDRINKLLVEQQQPAAPPPPVPPSVEEGLRGRLEGLSQEHDETDELAQGPGAQEQVARAKSAKRKVSERVAAAPPPAPHASKGAGWFLPVSAVFLVLALLAVGANVVMDRLTGDHGETPTGEVVEGPAEPDGQDMRVTAEMLALLQNADLENAAAEAAKCQMCHAFTADGPVMLGPPLYDLIGTDIASYEGFGYSTGDGGLSEVEGVWTYRNLDEFLERPKAIAENTTMIFVGERRPQARADLIAYLRTLTPGEPAPLPEALPPGVGYQSSTSEPEAPPPPVEGAPLDGEASEGGAMRPLQQASDSMLQQPLMIAGIALVLGALMILVIKLTRDAARRNRRPNLSSMSLDPEPGEDFGAPPSSPASEVLEEATALGADDTLFISYAHDDNERVDPVVRIVKSNGREVWIDKGGIQAGDGWAGEIVRAIKAAGGVMVMCSQRAFESDHIKREIYLADRYKKQILPIFLEEAQPPEDFEYFFAGVQWLELFKLPEADRASAIGRALAAV